MPPLLDKLTDFLAGLAALVKCTAKPSRSILDNTGNRASSFRKRGLISFLPASCTLLKRKIGQIVGTRNARHPRRCCASVFTGLAGWKRPGSDRGYRQPHVSALSGHPFDRSRFDETISGSGPNGAIVRAGNAETDWQGWRRGTYALWDSGAQYLDGTTDVTRTVLSKTALRACARRWNVLHRF